MLSTICIYWLSSLLVKSELAPPGGLPYACKEMLERKMTGSGLRKWVVALAVIACAVSSQARGQTLVSETTIVGTVVHYHWLLTTSSPAPFTRKIAGGRAFAGDDSVWVTVSVGEFGVIRNFVHSSPGQPGTDKHLF